MATGITYYSGSDDTCKLPGCTNPRYRERNGLLHDFCGRTHAQLYKATFGYTHPPSITGGTAKPVSSHRPKPLKAVHNLLSLPARLTSTSRSSNVSSKSIKFYNRDEPYYEFTNFYPASVVIDGQRWPSTEHYFQAQKFVGTPYLEVIRGLSSAREAFQLSRDPIVFPWRRSDWDTVKDDIMLKALRCKFAQHSDLRKMLWETGDKELIEHTTNDSYWADGGGHGKGQNKLGKLLMKVRDDIIAVCGPYHKPSKESTNSSVAKFGTSLRRSSSMSDLAGKTSSRRVESTSAGFATDDSLNSRLQAATLEASTRAKSSLKRSSSFSTMHAPSRSESSYKYSSRDPFNYDFTGAKSSIKRPSSFSTLHTTPSKSESIYNSPDYATHSRLPYYHSPSNSSSYTGNNHSTIQKHVPCPSSRSTSDTKDPKIKRTLLGLNPSTNKLYKLSKQTSTSPDGRTHVHPLPNSGKRTDKTQTRRPSPGRSTSSPKSSASSQSSQSKQRMTESRLRTFTWL